MKSNCSTYDTGGFVADASHGYFTIPSGVAKVRVSFGIYPKATVGGVTGVAARVKKNTASNFPGNIRLSETTWILGKPMQATSAVFSVAEGDTLKVHFNLSGADVVVDDNGYSYFAVEAVEVRGARIPYVGLGAAPAEEEQQEDRPRVPPGKAPPEESPHDPGPQDTGSEEDPELARPPLGGAEGEGVELLGKR